MSEMELLLNKLLILEEHIKKRFDREKGKEVVIQGDNRPQSEPILIIEKPTGINIKGIMSWIMKNIFLKKE